MKRIILFFVMMLVSANAFAGFQSPVQNIPYKYSFASGATVKTIKSGYGILHTMTVEGGTSSTIDLYDSTTAGGTIISSYPATNTPQTYTFDIAFTSGCTVSTGAALRIMFSYL